MIRDIEDYKINISITNEKITQNEELREKIKVFWQDVIHKSPKLWDGELMCVKTFNIKANQIDIICGKSNYSHYLYGERIGLNIKNACTSLVAGSLLETLDGYYILGELDESMSYPRCLQVSGGNADKADIENGTIDILKTIRRETLEELNIDIDDKNIVEESKIKYLRLPDENTRIYTYIIFAKAKLKITAEEMKIRYDKYVEYLKENDLEIEFGKIHFIKKENAIEELRKLDNPKREYLEELFLIDSKNE